jgi:hypothetical protein
LIAILPIDSSQSNNNIFLIQIPRIDAAKTAWDQIASIISKSK